MLNNLLLLVVWGVPAGFGEPVSQFQLDGAVAYITDGQRELMAMLDSKYEAEHATNFWNTVSGSVTIGAMLMIIGMTVGVSLICCWLRNQWDDILTGIERTYSTHGSGSMDFIESQMLATSRAGAILLTNSEAPPAYTDII